MGKIKKIKIKDFKSFRNTIIPFVGGFTSVVGPNGSGKSNISDAINFALGNSSMKTLRAGRLTDLVHHKSSSGCAEVVIELKEGKEKHEITRRIDKEGTSVFRLDKKRTTMSEITEFLSSLNISPQSRNIIMQGEVSDIVNMTPTQRREVIDDVSGIAEYNEKKDKALRELEKVEEKMKEANIILYERSGYLGELKKERNQALRYKQYSDQRELLKKAIAVKEISEVQEKLDGIIKKKITLGKEIEKIEEKTKEINAQHRNWENRIKELNKEIQEKGGSEQIEINKKIERAKNELALIEEKKKLKTEELDKKKEKETENQKKLEEFEEELKEKEISLKKLEREKKTYKQRMEEEQQNFDEFMDSIKGELAGEINKKLDEITTELESKKEEFYEIKNQVDQTRERISQKRLSISDSSKENKKAKERKKEDKKKLEELRKEIKNKTEEKKKLEESIIELEEMKTKTKNKKRELWERLEKTKKEYHSLESRLNTIKQVTGNKASKAVVTAGKEGELDGIIGTLGELCSFEDKHASIMQAVGSKKMNYVVTEDRESAIKAVKWLKEKKLGRTTFIPLDSVKAKKTDLKNLKKKGVVDALVNLVKHEKKIAPAISYAFGNTLVLKDLDSAKSMEGVKAVTVEGEIISSNGILTGGFEHGINIAGEIERMEELRKRIEFLEKEKDNLEHRNTEEELAGLSKEKSSLELELRESETVLKELDERQAEADQFEEKHASKLTQTEQEIDELKKTLTEKDQQMKEKKLEINTLEEKRELAKQKAESPETKEISKKVGKKQRTISSLREQLSEVDIQLSQIRSETKNIQEKIKELEEETNKQEETEIKKEIKEFEKQLEEKKKFLEEKIEEEKDISIATKELIEKRENLETRIRELSEQRGEQKRKLETKKEESNQKEIEKARYETRYSSIKEEMGQEPTKEELEQIKNMEEETATMKRDIEDLKQKMIRLEPVNLKAIQAYEDFLGEVDKIKERVQKLNQEKEAVIDLMEEIEKKRKEVFIEAFKKINESFGKVYQRFYLETEKAQASISLQNEEDPFRGGLTIEARPGGKEIKSIDELSTGEKTLTAIAFLFALQEYKPSPFYILDESDSALDKSNSERLAKMIKEKAEDTQFIAITHNNYLMHHSDQIVGVSMDKSKSSSVVEVDLKKTMSE